MTDQPTEPAAKTPAEAAMETFVYAPIGLLFEGASLLPQLVEKGRQQVAMAKMMGKFAVDQATSEATKAAGKLQDQAAGVLDFIGGSVAPVASDPAPAAPTKAAPKKKKAGAKGTSPARAAARQVANAANAAGRTASDAASSAAGAAAAAVEAAALAIPDYDGLSASHVVNRLAGLSAGELEAVRIYELAHRGRKTILSKVAQLQSS